MFLPLEFLWKQLNGPQITGVTKAIFEFIKDSFDNTLEYLNNFSLRTANDSHLTELGKIMNVIRPIISIREEKFVVFSDDIQYPVDYGFNDTEDPSVIGGVFDNLLDMSGVNKLVSAELFRNVLIGMVNHDCEDYGLRMLDEILNQLSEVSAIDKQRPYEFIFTEEPTEELIGRTYGDLIIDLQYQASWNKPYVILAIMEALADGLYAPIPRIFPTIKQGVPVSEIPASWVTALDNGWIEVSDNSVSVTTSGKSQLQELEIPNSIIALDERAFTNCTSLISVTIPNSVTTIGSQAFMDCTSLTSVTVEPTTPPELGSNAFISTPADLVIYVPAESVDTYKAASGWSTYADKIQPIT